MTLREVINLFGGSAASQPGSAELGAGASDRLRTAAILGVGVGVVFLIASIVSKILVQLAMVALLGSFLYAAAQTELAKPARDLVVDQADPLWQKIAEFVRALAANGK